MPWMRRLEGLGGSLFSCLEVEAGELVLFLYKTFRCGSILILIYLQSTPYNRRKASSHFKFTNSCQSFATSFGVTVVLLSLLVGPFVQQVISVNIKNVQLVSGEASSTRGLMIYNGLADHIKLTQGVSASKLEPRNIIILIETS